MVLSFDFGATIATEQPPACRDRYPLIRRRLRRLASWTGGSSIDGTDRVKMRCSLIVLETACFEPSVGEGVIGAGQRTLSRFHVHSRVQSTVHLDRILCAAVAVINSSSVPSGNFMCAFRMPSSCSRPGLIENPMARKPCSALFRYLTTIGM